MADEAEARTDARLIEHLVGSVLTSVVKAQGLAASQLVQLIDEVGFEPEVPGQPRRARTFSFEFLRNEIDDETDTVVQRKVTANVPLLTLINLPSIAIEEAKIQMDLRLVAHQESSEGVEDPNSPLKLYAVPAKKQLVRSEQSTIAVDSAGTIKMQVTLRQQEPLGLERMQSLLEDGTDQIVEPLIPGSPGVLSEPDPVNPDPPSPGPERSPAAESLSIPAGAVARDVPAVADAELKPATKKRPAARKSGSRKATKARPAKRGTASTSASKKKSTKKSAAKKSTATTSASKKKATKKRAAAKKKSGAKKSSKKAASKRAAKKAG